MEFFYTWLQSTIVSLGFAIIRLPMGVLVGSI